MTRVAVVGGGITGLAAAWRLMTSGAEVTLLEETDRLGGKVLTGQFGDRPVDLGPDAFVARTPEVLQLCHELGLESELVTSATDQAAVWVRGRLRFIPQDVVLGVPSRLTSVARSLILSPVGLARAALDVVLPRRGDGGDRSVGDLVTTRLGRQVRDRLVDPLFGGIHAGSSTYLSVQATAPQLAAAAASRSLMRGVRLQRRTEAAGRPAFHSLRGGLSRLVERLEEELRSGGAEIHLETAVGSLPLEGFDASIVTTPAPVAANLVAEASPIAAAELRGIDHASVTLTVLAYPSAAFPRPLVGSGFLVPPSEGRLITACSFASSKWPHWAGPDEVLLRVSAGRFGDGRALEMSDVELVQGVHNELVEALELTD
ncbi:MAG: protoporphyrinogen oxidase, partial [Actinomycetota bacterium]|nr:protoporphyrinogen oxidase [Actinomycetota bacterium]